VESRRVVVDEGRGDFYIYGWTHRKKKNNKRTREGTQKKKKEKTTSRERDIHTLTLSALSFCFSNITSTRKHTRARLPLPPKPKPKKTSDVAALNENLRKEWTYTQIYLAFLLRRFLVNIFFVNYRLDIFILYRRERNLFFSWKKKKIVMYIGLYINYPDLRLPNRCFHHLLSSLLFKC